MNNFVSAKEVRESILKMLYQGKASHLGSCMSVVEMLIAMYSAVDCSKILTNSPDRSRVFVSKGHCAAATYATMAHFGIFPLSDLSNYHLEGSLMAGHVSHGVKGVEHSTGALGHGINVAVGAAIGLRSMFPSSKAKVLVLCGDGEIQEGSVWEALMLACHHNLHNLFILIDNNRISSIDKTDLVINLSPVTDKFSAFGANTFEVDGHNITDIFQHITDSDSCGKPTVIVCNTIKGKGVEFAEWQPVWHYRTLDEALYTQALAQLK
jgi:transketolase